MRSFVLVVLAIAGCARPIVAPQPAPALRSPVTHAAAPTMPTPASPIAFDVARAIADGPHHRAVAVAERVTRFAPVGTSGASTPELVLQEQPPIRARAVYREDAETCGDTSMGRWSLELTVGADRWEIGELASWTTDCAAIDDGFGRDAIRLQARDLIPGGPLELVVDGVASLSSYIDDCECTVRGGMSTHIWACGLVAQGSALRPVCWAHVETQRELGASTAVEDCACAANVPRESWALEAELVAPGRLRVTADGHTDSHELARLPCALPSPPPAFACTAP